MDHKKLHKIIGAGVLVLASLVYLMTVQPTVSFWDCGEFIASAYHLQVPHPPGTPLFLLLGRLMAILPLGGNVGYEVNLISVFSSAFTTMFLYLIAVKVIENFKGKRVENLLDAFGTYITAAIGALSLTFAETFWFNANEAEVYALSTFFIAFVTWLMMVWHEKADQADNEKYILLIAYLIGLSTGVHLMAVLAIVPIVMTVMFRKYITDEEDLKKSGYILLGNAALVLIVAFALWASQTGGPPSREAYNAFDMRFVLIMAVITVVYIAAFWKKVMHRNSFYIPLIIGGIALFATYPGIVKMVPNLIASLGGNVIAFDIAILAAIFLLLGYLIHWSNKANKQTLHLVFKALMFVLIGFSTYSMIIIRSNLDTPINLNSPKTFPELVSYLNREQYGDFPTFQRRFSQEPHQQDIYNQYDSDLDFLISYQINHMFHRYLGWNYVGRESTVQDDGVEFSDLYAIPLLIGLFGLFYHYKRDWKMASIFLVMFIFLGYLTAFYQNQQQPQPRERHYFYVGALFVYSMWIAIGSRGILDYLTGFLRKYKFKNAVLSLAMVVLFIAVPINMLSNNFHTHDRSDNYVPWDYAYNLLQSAPENAVLFTNGDNDTFPLWYLQDVEGVRRDVRIANLSLLNTPWYILQLKNQTPYGAEKVDMNMSDRAIRNIRPQRWQPQKLSLPINQRAIEEFNIKDTSLINQGQITWTMKNTTTFGNTPVVRVQDLVVKDIIEANRWKRPICFAVTCSEDSKIGLQKHLRMKGMAYELVPFKRKSKFAFVKQDVMKEHLFDHPDGFYRDYNPGFKFRGLSDSTIFFDSNHRKLVANYRNSYLRLTLDYLYNDNKDSMAVETLNEMEEQLPRTVVPMDKRLLFDVAKLYDDAGAEKEFREITKDLEEYAYNQIEKNPRSFSGRYNPYSMLLETYDRLEEYNKALDVLGKLKQVVPDDAQLQQYIQRYKRLARQQGLEDSLNIPDSIKMQQ
jgi:hypothetical protein